ncbi:MAG: WD40/YVTN/BNR-like repeat-containing protein [Lysobacterales bacterium]
MTWNRYLPGYLLGLLLAGFFSPEVSNAKPVPEALFDGLEYRLIGPWRGGRVTAVHGVAGDNQRYYMGATGGGLWKTTNAGQTWDNISDGQIPVGTIGAIGVAPSDPNVIYVGTGEAPIRGVTTSQGEGLWKSTDAGQSFTFMGLPKAGQIAKIQVHPRDPDLAFVAVQGQIWAPNPERGVYRTKDGGKTWEHVLAVNADTGATDITMDPTNPRILYAGLWHHGRKPWFIKSGGEGGGIYKSVNGGDSWEQLSGGLPDLIGKTGIAVSADDPARVYAIIEAGPGKGGIWRSDNYGAQWSLVNGHRALWSRAWYYIHIGVDPTDADTVWAMNTRLYKSVNGGVDWEQVSAPHGDHHDLWFNPANGNNIINGNDGGANITFDGGETWSSIENQPTAQLYRLITDNQDPYRLYAGQQDNSTLSIASYAWDGGIGVDDYYDVGGGESAHIAFDPDNPALIYATTINGTLTEYNHANRKTRYIIPYPELVYGMDSKDLKYRANWNPPVITSPHDHSTIYYGTQYLLKSTNRGLTWTEASPDLTRNNPEHMGRNGGPLTPENVGAEFYHTIFAIEESKNEAGTIWVGADDGMLHITRDGGENWADISPPHRGEAMINAIDLSPHAEGTAYLAVTGYKLNDFKPYIYKTTNHGERWRRIDAGLPDGSFVRVVREDPVTPGLLYAGTEKGLFISFDDGGSWQAFDLNLPAVPITDLRARKDGLAVATQGRSIWVLDDLWLLRQAKNDLATHALHLYQPPVWAMGKPASGPDDFEGANPEPDVPLYYIIRDEVDADAKLTIEILNDDGALVRRMSSVEGSQERCEKGNEEPRQPITHDYPPADQGFNRWYWDLRSDDVPCIDNLVLHAGFDGPSVAPGFYTARITLGDATATSRFEITKDPRSFASDTEIADWADTLATLKSLLSESLTTLDEGRRARAQVKALLAKHEDPELHELGQNAISGIDAWEAKITQLKFETYEDEDAWATLFDGQLRYLMDTIDYSGAPVTQGMRLRQEDLTSQWERLASELDRVTADYIEPINHWARKRSEPHVAPPR